MHGADTPNAGFTSQTVSLNRNSDPLAPLPRLTTPARPEIALLRGNHIWKGGPIRPHSPDRCARTHVQNEYKRVRMNTRNGNSPNKQAQPLQQADCRPPSPRRIPLHHQGCRQRRPQPLDHLQMDELASISKCQHYLATGNCSDLLRRIMGLKYLAHLVVV